MWAIHVILLPKHHCLVTLLVAYAVISRFVGMRLNRQTQLRSSITVNLQWCEVSPGQLLPCMNLRSRVYGGIVSGCGIVEL